MNYVKKMCILRQIRQGFSGDGKSLSGLIKIEQYGKNIAVEVSVINFAPLASGEYYCLLSDGKGKTEMLTLRGKSLFNLLSDLDISSGFCGIICYVKNEVVPIAYGINGNKTYDWRAILNATLPPVFPSPAKQNPSGEIAGSAPLSTQNEDAMYALNEDLPPPPLPQTTRVAMQTESARAQIKETLPHEPQPNQKTPAPSYDDDTLAMENYYEEKTDERQQSEKTQQNAHTESAAPCEGKKIRSDKTENDPSKNVRDAFKTDPDGYYLAVKQEIDALFKKYPRDKTLSGVFCCSDWVRVKGNARDPQYLVGVLRIDERVRYICYALATEDKNNPPEEIKNVCTFVPANVFNETQGFFIIFQSAATGECIRPELT